LALELANCADVVPAILAVHVRVVVCILINREAVAAAFTAIEFDAHQRRLRATLMIVQSDRVQGQSGVDLVVL
jgi:hypothetical protein